MLIMLLHVIQALTAVLCIAIGVGALAGVRPVRGLGLTTRWARWPVGALLVLGGLGLGYAIWAPFYAFFSAVLLALILLTLAIVSLVRLGQRRGSRWALPIPVVLLAVVAIGALQPLGLQVLLLPKADHLPYEPVAARVVKTYGPGMWFEGIAQGNDGTLYLAESKGEDYNTGDKSDVHAQVIARAADGTEHVFFQLPTGSTAGVMAIGGDGTMYMAVTGHQRGLWRVAPTGQGQLLAPLPDGSFPNGVTVGPRGNVYVADGGLGVIWRINPATGAATRAYQGDILKPRPYVALPPGANGIHYFRSQMYVTNSDAGKLLRFDVDHAGNLQHPQTLVRGVPSDDFAIDTDGTIYLTTHIYNTIVRVDPTGRRTVIADKRQRIDGATDCIIAENQDHTETVYAVTDGGALETGNTSAAGTLVALTLPAA